MGVLGAGGPQNLNCGDCNPQKAHLWIIPSRLSIYTSKSVHGFGLAAFPRKRKKENKKKSHTRSIFRQNSPSHGGATGYSIGTKFGRMVAPLDLITLANFYLDRLTTGCVAHMKVFYLFGCRTTSAVALNTAWPYRAA